MGGHVLDDVTTYSDDAMALSVSQSGWLMTPSPTDDCLTGGQPPPPPPYVLAARAYVRGGGTCTMT